MPPRAIPSLVLGSIELPKFTCPSCSFVRAIARVSLRRRVLHLQSLRRKHCTSTIAIGRRPHLEQPTAYPIRGASTFASPATVNKPLNIPPQVNDLYEALDALKTEASSYVNLSRLQLALRGLESGNGKATIRIAVLGLGDAGSGRVRSLVRLALADPLGKEGEWEKELVDGKQDGRGLLIRFGDETDTLPSNPLLRTILAPSRVLETHNFEILISSLRTEMSSTTDAGAVQEALLVPTLETPTSASGRFSHVTYPVHKTLVLGNSAQSLLEYGRFAGSATEQDLPNEMVKVAVDFPGTRLDASSSEVQKKEAVTVDLSLAEESLKQLRESLSNSQSYEHGWYRSEMPGVTDWLLADTTTETSPLKPTIQSLVTSLLASASRQIDISSYQSTQSVGLLPVSESTRTDLLQYLSSWAEKSHTELRDQLDLAFASKHWARLKWWKLFWRVDDVSMIASEILERRWLVEAEKSLIFLAGRVTGAGILESSEREIKPEEEKKIGEGELYGPTLEDLQKDDIMAADAGDVSPITESKPWPLHITITRHHLATTTIPSLQALAQKLVLQTMSTTSLTAAISALAYVSVTSTSLAEAGVVAAFGFVLSLKRMQNKWEAAREFWEGELREEGRVCLKETEERVRTFVQKEGKVTEDLEAVSERDIANKAVLRAQEALNAVK